MVHLEDEIGLFELITRTLSLVVFLIILYVDDGMGIMAHPIDIKIKGALLGYALVGNSIIGFFGGKK